MKIIKKERFYRSLTKKLIKINKKGIGDTMKKLLAVIFLVVVGFYGCRDLSVIKFGDKSLEDIKKSQELFADKIDYYQQKIKNLQEENSQLTDQLIQSPADSLLGYKKMIKRNDSLAVYYQNELKLVESQETEFLFTAAGKDRRAVTKLSGDAKEVADAYLIYRYADNMIGVGNANQTAEKEKNNQTGLKGILVNDRFDDVIARVTGPGSFFREFSIKAHSKTPPFPLPFIGRFTTTFISCRNENDRRSITKTVGPNIIYWDEGQPYDYRVVAVYRN